LELVGAAENASAIRHAPCAAYCPCVRGAMVAQGIATRFDGGEQRVELGVHARGGEEFAPGGVVAMLSEYVVCF